MEDPIVQIMKDNEVTECRKCRALVAKDRKFGRLPHKKDATICECCEPDPKFPPAKEWRGPR